MSKSNDMASNAMPFDPRAWDANFYVSARASALNCLRFRPKILG